MSFPVVVLVRRVAVVDEARGRDRVVVTGETPIYPHVTAHSATRQFRTSLHYIALHYITLRTSFVV